MKKVLQMHTERKLAVVDHYSTNKEFVDAVEEYLLWEKLLIKSTGPVVFLVSAN